MLRTFFSLFFLGIVVVVLFAGFRDSEVLPSRMAHPPIEIFPDMDHQPKFQPQHPSGFFADGRAARVLVPGTIPQGYEMKGSYLQAPAKNGTFSPVGFTNQPNYYNTGKFGDVYGDGFPVEVKVDPAFIKRGRERYDINCAVCHGLAGLGNGVTGQYGLVAIANLHDERIRLQPDGQIYSTITNGKNTMGAYGPNISLDDRWAIVAYIRALQKSQLVKLSDLPADKQKEFQSKQ